MRRGRAREAPLFERSAKRSPQDTSEPLAKRQTGRHPKPVVQVPLSPPGSDRDVTHNRLEHVGDALDHIGA